MVYKSLFFRYLLIFSLLFSANFISAQPSADEGKTLFKSNCLSCHNKNMRDDMTGPALGGVEENWESQEDLYAWIRNSQAMIQAGHPRAVELWNQYKPNIMSNFPNLTDDQIASILLYIDGVYTGTYGATAAVAGVVATDGVVEEESDNTLLFVTLFLILGILAIVLTRIVSNLNHMVEVSEGNTNAERRTLVELLTSKAVIGFVIFALVIFGGYTTVNNAINLGRQQGYQPTQPIKFSHEIHAGIQKIECQYCHDGARRSKHSVIPASNTCMNCHKAIEKGSLYGTAEIGKIFVSAGYDPIKNKYIEDYDDMPQEEIEELFKTWIGEEYVKDEGIEELDETGEKVVADQWEDWVAALTNEQKKEVKGPIEWVRIHNLPDHAYFNHAQHVTVGKVECQQCHGPIEEMEEVYQYSPLSMGWCINCHRETNVQFVENDYYDSYELYHKQLKEGTRSGVTVEEIGGLECQKCHY